MTWKSNISPPPKRESNKTSITQWEYSCSRRTIYYMDVEELDPLMSQIPAAYNNDETIIRIKENVEKMKATAVGQKFTDFEMQTPEEKR